MFFSEYLQQNLRAFILKISWTFNDINNGSVCALYLLPNIIRTDLFWSFNIRVALNPQTRIGYLIWGRIDLLHMVCNVFWGRYCLSLFIIPKDLEIVFDAFCICAIKIICWSMVTWKWRHNQRDGVSNHQPHTIVCLLHRPHSRRAVAADQPQWILNANNASWAAMGALTSMLY